jgi:flagella basal body P-ring formation protein FlgA
MRLRMLLMFLTAAYPLPGSCLVVQDGIRAGDLASRVPAFSRLPADEMIAEAPAWGRRQVITQQDLRSMALTRGISLQDEAPDLCVEAAGQRFDQASLTETIRGVIGDESVQIEIVDWIRSPIPQGTVEFPTASRSRAPFGRAQDPVLWRGLVRHQNGLRTTPIWVRLRAYTMQVQLVAARDLRIGTVIGENDVREERREVPWGAAQAAPGRSDVIGMRLRRSLRSGQVLVRDVLAAEPKVAAGKPVSVAVESGAARLSFQGFAESSGGLGQSVVVRNAETMRRFRAVVVDEGQVRVQCGKGDRYGC